MHGILSRLVFALIPQPLLLLQGQPGPARLLGGRSPPLQVEANSGPAGGDAAGEDGGLNQH